MIDQNSGHNVNEGLIAENGHISVSITHWEIQCTG